MYILWNPNFQPLKKKSFMSFQLFIDLLLDKKKTKHLVRDPFPEFREV